MTGDAVNTNGLMIGCTVIFSTTKEVEKKGVVMDKIDMIDKDVVITGYLICYDKTLLIKPVQNWRITKIVSFPEKK